MSGVPSIENVFSGIFVQTGNGPVKNRISWQYYEWDQNKLILSALTHFIFRLGSFVHVFHRAFACQSYVSCAIVNDMCILPRAPQSPHSKLGSCSDHPFADFTLPNINICTPSQYLRHPYFCSLCISPVAEIALVSLCSTAIQFIQYRTSYKLASFLLVEVAFIRHWAVVPVAAFIAPKTHFPCSSI